VSCDCCHRLLLTTWVHAASSSRRYITPRGRIQLDWPENHSPSRDVHDCALASSHSGLIARARMMTQLGAAHTRAGSRNASPRRRPCFARQDFGVSSTLNYRRWSSPMTPSHAACTLIADVRFISLTYSPGFFIIQEERRALCSRQVALPCPVQLPATWLGSEMQPLRWRFCCVPNVATLAYKHAHAFQLIPNTPVSRPTKVRRQASPCQPF
jgi:hypothetical protein